MVGSRKPSCFRFFDAAVYSDGVSSYYDRIAPRYRGYSAEDFKTEGARVTPGAVVRDGAYVAPDVMLMPSFVNVGAWVGAMLDTWATVGSCAQIGEGGTFPEALESAVCWNLPRLAQPSLKTAVSLARAQSLSKVLWWARAVCSRWVSSSHKAQQPMTGLPASHTTAMCRRALLWFRALLTGPIRSGGGHLGENRGRSDSIEKVHHRIVEEGLSVWP